MITVNTKKWGKIKIDGLCNQRESIANPYVIGIQLGYDCSCFLAYAFSEDDALDVFVDSKYGHLVIVDNEEDEKEYEEMEILSYHGNEGKPCQLDNLVILERAYDIDYFAKRED